MRLRGAEGSLLWNDPQKDEVLDGVVTNILESGMVLVQPWSHVRYGSQTRSIPVALTVQDGL